MDLGLKGKTALVAASSKGLGRAVAEELAREGAKLVMCARKVRPLERARLAIFNETGTEVVAVPADLSEPADVDRVVAAAKAEFGRIDILVTNTGGPPPGPSRATRETPGARRSARISTACSTSRETSSLPCGTPVGEGSSTSRRWR